MEPDDDTLATAFVALIILAATLIVAWRVALW
jgi:hypothetical protein